MTEPVVTAPRSDTVYERVAFRDGGKVRTWILKDLSEGEFLLKGTRVDGRGQEFETNRTESQVTINIARGLISRTPMSMNAAGTELESTQSPG